MKSVLIIIVIIALALLYYLLSPGVANHGNAQFAQYEDSVRLFSPLPGEYIESPLTVTGEARGSWFFEASFPVILTNWDGLIIAEGIATSEGDWMTSEYVPFVAELEFEKPSYKDNGSLILRRDNPSGLPEFDDAFEITVYFK